MQTCSLGSFGKWHGRGPRRLVECLLSEPQARFFAPDFNVAAHARVHGSEGITKIDVESPRWQGLPSVQLVPQVRFVERDLQPGRLRIEMNDCIVICNVACENVLGIGILVGVGNRYRIR
jgi:hypothetical protein